MKSKTDKRIRDELIALFDKTDAWEHVAMNYIDFVEHFDSGVLRKWSRPFARKINHIIGDVMELRPVRHSRADKRKAAK